MNAVVASPLMDLIRLYFPPEEWERAACVANAEGARLPGRVQDEGYIGCGHGTRAARSHGPFRILDVCFDPSLNPDSWFTPEQWAHVDDLNVNVWMASIIWARWGWRAWSTCEQCGACEVRGKPIPRPRGPEQAARAMAAADAPVITADSDFRVQSIGDAGVRSIMKGTPLEDHTDAVIGWCKQYQVDANWVLAYLMFESGFNASEIARSNHNPFDILCWPNCGGAQNWGASGCDRNANGYCYVIYPNVLAGLEAGIRQFGAYPSNGWGTTWGKTLSVALCGNINGCNDPWVDNVIAAGNANARKYPVGPGPVSCDPNDPANWGESGSECAPDGRVYDYRWNRCLADGRGDFERFNYRTVPGQCEGPPPPIQIENPAGTAFVVGITAFVASVGLWWRLARGGSL